MDGFASNFTMCPGYPFSWTMGRTNAQIKPPRLEAQTNNHLFWCPRCEMAMIDHSMRTFSGEICDAGRSWCTHPNEPLLMTYLGEVGKDRIAATKSDSRAWR